MEIRLEELQEIGRAQGRSGDGGDKWIGAFVQLGIVRDDEEVFK